MTDRYLDTAIQNFYDASMANSQLAAVNTIALGLQQVCAGVRARRPRSRGDQYLRTAIDNFYDASMSGSQSDAIGRIALGLQQMTAGLKGAL
jgi:hypothetical protein